MTMIKPPLAFAGHKGAWHEELQTLFESLPNGATVVDVFGGSGICAHIAKSCRPDLRVVCNDFDEYAVRLSHVSETELLRQKLLNLLGRKETGKAYRKLCDNEIERVQEILNDWRNQYGFVDELSVSRWLFLYPMNKDRISKKKGMVNRITLAPFDVEKCDHWFDGIERVFFDVTKTDIFGLFPGAYFIFDPPYMATNCDDYDKKETLHILADIVTQVRHGGFILFGDSSASFCYDLIVENRQHKKFEKLMGSIFGIKRRVEVLYTDLDL